MKQIDNLPWVESPFFDELVEQDQTLSADMRSKVQFFSENGYLIVDLIFPQSKKVEVRACRMLGASSRK